MAACVPARHMRYRLLWTVRVRTGSVSGCAMRSCGRSIVLTVSGIRAGNGAVSTAACSCVCAGVVAGGVVRGGARNDSYKSHTAIDSTIAIKTRLSVFMLFSFVPVRLHGFWLHTRFWSGCGVMPSCHGCAAAGPVHLWFEIRRSLAHGTNF
jgi:hypothetical protein